MGQELCCGGDSGMGMAPTSGAVVTDFAGSSITTVMTVLPPGQWLNGSCSRTQPSMVIIRRILKGSWPGQLHRLSLGAMNLPGLQMFSTHKGQSDPTCVRFDAAGDAADSIIPKQQLCAGLQHLITVPVAQLLLDSSPADQFGHGFLTEITALFGAHPIDQTQFEGVGVPIQFAGAGRTALSHTPLLQGRIIRRSGCAKAFRDCCVLF